MGKSLKVHQTNGTDNVDQTLSARDRKQLVRLGKLWKSDAERGLKTRHQMGRVLNERVGPPTRRKAHGRRVLELYGAELGIAPSDLNRMGWFSHLFPDFSDLRTRHPEIDSWTRFKTELPNLKPAKGGKARQPALNPSRPALRGVVKSCTNLASKLNGLDLQLGKAERKGFLDAFRELGEAVSRRFRVRVEVAVGVKERKPVVTKRSDRVARA
jgi:hypothetical protein